MTTLLKKAFETVSKLPDIEQNKLARWIIEELEADNRWANSFAESEDILEKLSDEESRIENSEVSELKTKD